MGIIKQLPSKTEEKTRRQTVLCPLISKMHMLPNVSLLLNIYKISEKQNQVPWFSCVASTIWIPFTEHWDPLSGIRVTVPPTFSKTQCSLSKSRPWRTRRGKERRKLVPTLVSAMIIPGYLFHFPFEHLFFSRKVLWTVMFSESIMSSGRDRGMHWWSP